MAVLCASRSDVAEEARAAPLHVPAALLRKKGAELNSWPLQFAPLPLSNSCRPAKSSLFYCQISFLVFSPPAPVALSVYDHLLVHWQTQTWSGAELAVAITHPLTLSPRWWPGETAAIASLTSTKFSSLHSYGTPEDKTQNPIKKCSYPGNLQSKTRRS